MKPGRHLACRRVFHFGAGTRYDLTLANPTSVDELSLDSVVGLESFRTSVDAVLLGLGTPGACYSVVHLGAG